MSRILDRVTRHTEQARELERHGGVDRLAHDRHQGHDEQRLRYIPVIGATGGAIPGTRPDHLDR